MKLIDEKEVEEAAEDCAFCAIGNRQTFTDIFIFKSAVSFTEQKLQPMMVELIDWIDKNEWNNNVTSREKLEQFLKTKQK